MASLCKASSLNRERRRRDLDAITRNPHVDVLVVGGGITGAGVALDAAARGLSVLLVEKHDLAYGTSRFSSKLIHGGLRYLAHGDVAIARESAIERGILMARTAPHLVQPRAMMMPLPAHANHMQAAFIRAGLLFGDLLRAGTGTPAALLPRARRITVTETLERAPVLQRSRIRGSLLYWDGQVVDDARLVVAVARTAAAYGARILTRCAALTLTGAGAQLRDAVGGVTFDVHARAVINATGVWAGRLVDDVRLRPSRGSHLVLPRHALAGLATALTIPVPGARSRFVLVLPQPDGRVYVGLTDEPVEGPIPEVAQPSRQEIEFLLEVLNSALRIKVRGPDVAGAFAGFRPLLDGSEARTADLSRRHAVAVSRDGVITVVGGKLTTYRRMAEEATDVAVAVHDLAAGPCRTRWLPLVGAADRDTLGRIAAPARLVARYGTEALDVIADPGLTVPVADGVDVTHAELAFAVRHECALDVDDLLQRRTRVGLVRDDYDAARPAALEALAQYDLMYDVSS